MVFFKENFHCGTRTGEQQMTEGLALGIDLGGTKIYAVVTDREHRVIADAKAATPSGATPEQLAAAIVALGKEALAPLHTGFEDLDGIGVAIPAPVDPDTGDCLHATNLGIKNFSLKETLRKLTGREVYLGNDGSLGVLAEYHCGAARGFRTVIGYYVGTGLGGGIMIDGKLHNGNSGLAGEFGHAIIKQGGRQCGCGHRGCAEAYCSKVGFVKALKKLVFKQGMTTTLPSDKFNETTRNIKSRHLAKAYRAGDGAVCKVINKGAFMLGVAAASTAAILAPDCIILGGGVISALGDEMYPVFKRSFDEHLFGLDPAKINIRITRLGDNAVALGATVLARLRGKV